jgi:hypothetical protein
MIKTIFEKYFYSRNSKIAIIIYGFPLNVEHWDHTNYWAKSIWTIDMSKFSKSSASLYSLLHKNPIPFVCNVKNVDKVDCPDTDQGVHMWILTHPHNNL